MRPTSGDVGRAGSVRSVAGAFVVEGVSPSGFELADKGVAVLDNVLSAVNEIVVADEDRTAAASANPFPSVVEIQAILANGGEAGALAHCAAAGCRAANAVESNDDVVGVVSGIHAKRRIGEVAADDILRVDDGGVEIAAASTEHAKKVASTNRARGCGGKVAERAPEILDPASLRSS